MEQQISHPSYDVLRRFARTVFFTGFCTGACAMALIVFIYQGVML